MHNHDDDKQGSWMMWAMMICCILPLLVLAFGFGGKALGASNWIIVGGVVAMIVAHFVVMHKSHKHSDEKRETTNEEDNKNKKNHSSHGCCH